MEVIQNLGGKNFVGKLEIVLLHSLSVLLTICLFLAG